MHRHILLLLALSFLAGAAHADMDGNIMVAPVTGKSIDITLEEGDTLDYSFEVLSPAGSCVDFTYIPSLGPQVNHPCVQNGSDSLSIGESGMHRLKFSTKGGKSVGIHVRYAVNPVDGALADAEDPQTPDAWDGPCPSSFTLLVLAGACVLVRR
jgi:hypothetical protein